MGADSSGAEGDGGASGDVGGGVRAGEVSVGADPDAVGCIRKNSRQKPRYTRGGKKGSWLAMKHCSAPSFSPKGRQSIA